MKIGDRVEMKDSSRLGTYWGTVESEAGGNLFWVHWDKYDGHNWIWMPTKMHYDDIIESGGVVHAA